MCSLDLETVSGVFADANSAVEASMLALYANSAVGKEECQGMLQNLEPIFMIVIKSNCALNDVHGQQSYREAMFPGCS